MYVRRCASVGWQLLRDAFFVYVTLLKVLIPALLVVKGLEWLGAIEWLGEMLSPLMGWLGLPDAMGVVWAATLLTNIFTGLVVFFEVAGDMSLSVAQVTVLGALMLVGHSLPVEGAVAKRAGVPGGSPWCCAWEVPDAGWHSALGLCHGRATSGNRRDRLASGAAT